MLAVHGAQDGPRFHSDHHVEVNAGSEWNGRCRSFLLTPDATDPAVPDHALFPVPRIEMENDVFAFRQKVDIEAIKCKVRFAAQEDIESSGKQTGKLVRERKSRVIDGRLWKRLLQLFRSDGPDRECRFAVEGDAIQNHVTGNVQQVRSFDRNPVPELDKVFAIDRDFESDRIDEK